MTEYGGGKESPIEKIGFFLLIGAMVLLFITLLQPVWRGQDMVAELKDDCAKRGGVVLQHEKMFGTSYECTSRLD